MVTGQMIQRFSFLSGLLLMLLTASGCAVQKIPETACSRDCVQEPEQLISLISHLYPVRFSALHQVVLDIRGRTMSLSGYLNIDHSKGQVDLVAQPPMGGTLFEVHLCRNKPDVVLTKGFLKKKWLEASVVHDLHYLYAKPVVHSVNICELNDKTILFDADGPRTTCYTFLKSTPSLRLSEVRVLNKNRLEYKIDYQYASGSPMPGFIKIENIKANYTLNINQHIIPDKNQANSN